MSYESESTLGEGTRIGDVREFVELLGYKKQGVLRSKEHGNLEQFWYFEEKDYRSWSGVELSISKSGRSLIVYTRTPVARSYFDLIHQNKTIASLRKCFGGKFVTDAGGGRYMRPDEGPPSPQASGCHLAFHRFGTNLIRSILFLEARAFPKHPPKGPEDPMVQMGLDPRVLGNNMLIPFLVASVEDYFKSTYIALLRYSSRKAAVLKGARLQGEQLVQLSDGTAKVEDQLAEMMSFQNISAVCRHFEGLDNKLDLSGSLRKPYRRRKQSLFELIEWMVSVRHGFIHRTQIDPSVADKKLEDLVYDLDAAITRVYRRITNHYGWTFDRGWYLGNRAAKARCSVGA